jgi:hypothetical protein
MDVSLSLIGTTRKQKDAPFPTLAKHSISLCDSQMITGAARFHRKTDNVTSIPQFCDAVLSGTGEQSAGALCSPCDSGQDGRATW